MPSLTIERILRNKDGETVGVSCQKCTLEFLAKLDEGNLWRIECPNCKAQALTDPILERYYMRLRAIATMAVQTLREHETEPVS